MSGIPSVQAVNGSDIAAQVGGMRMRSIGDQPVVGVALIQVYGAGVQIEGDFAGGLARGSFLPGIRLKGSFEDFGFPKTCLPGADLSELRGVRVSGAGALMPGSSLVNANLPRVNLQKADLRGANLSGLKAEGAYLEEADIRGATVTPATDLSGSHLADCRRDPGALHADNVKGADFGPSGPEAGNKRTSMRARVQAQQTAGQQTIGG